MNLFSFFAAAGMVLMVAAGLLLINYGNNLGEDVPSTWELASSIAGVVLILLAAALVLPLNLMRRAVKISRQVRATTDIDPMVEALAVTHRFWKYMTWMVFICLCFSILGAFAAALILL